MSENFNRSLLTVNDDYILAKSNGEVKNASQFNFSKREKGYRGVEGGLYSSKIFGQYYRCFCNRRTTPGLCDHCKTRVLDPNDTLNLFGHYNLCISVIYEISLGQFIDDLRKVLPVLGNMFSGTSVDKKYVSIWNRKIVPVKVEANEEIVSYRDYVRDESGEVYRLQLDMYDKADTKDSYGYYGVNGLNSLFTNYTTMDGNSFENLKQYIHNLIVIAPIYMRKPCKYNGTLQIPPMSSNYAMMIEIDKRTKSILETSDDLADMLMVSYVENKMVNEVLKTYSIIASSKESLVRYVGTSRLAKSGRAVAVGRGEIKIDEMLIPVSMAYEAIKGDIINKIEEIDQERMATDPTYTPRDAFFLYENPTPEVMEIFKAIINGDPKYNETGTVVVMNRAPSLHKLSMQAFHAKLWEDKTIAAIGVNQNVVEGFNLDFDGDQIAIYFLTKEPTKSRIFNKMSPKNNWYYFKNKAPVFVPKSSMLLGLYYATKMEMPADQKGLKEYFNFDDLEYEYGLKKIDFNTVVLFEGRKTTYGREKVAQIIGLPLDQFAGEYDKETDKFIPTPVSTANIAKIISAIDGREDRTDIVTELLHFSKKITTLMGSSIATLGDLYKIDPDFPEIETILKSRMSEDEKYRKLEALIPKLVMKKINDLGSTTYVDAIKGGDKVKPHSLIETFGPQIKYDKGKITVYNESIITGMSDELLIHHATTNREILNQKASMVPISGYFTRQFVNVMQDLMYNANELSPDTVGIVLPKWLASGRTGLDGKLIEKNNSTELIRVKSSVGRDGQIIYKDEIDYNFYKLEDKAFIGFDMSTSMSENITQSSLGLKHGGKLYFPSEDKLIAIDDLTLEGKNQECIKLRTKSGNYLVYPLQYNAILSEDLNNGNVDKGKVVYYSGESNYVDHRLASLKAFLGVLAGDIKTKDLQVHQCFALTSGKIKYDFNRHKVSIGAVEYTLHKDAIYYYPDGWDVQRGDRICSGILNLPFLVGKEKDPGWAFYIFLKAFIEILYGTEPFEKHSLPISLESMELLFKELYAGRSAAVSTVNRGNKRLFSKMNYGYNKEAVQKNINKPILDSIGLRLILGDTKFEGYK